MTPKEMRQQYTDEMKVWLMNHDAGMPYPDWLESRLAEREKELETERKHYVEDWASIDSALEKSGVKMYDEHGRIPTEDCIDSLTRQLSESRQYALNAQDRLLTVQNQIQGLGLESPISVADVLKENERLHNIMKEHAADGDTWFDEPSLRKQLSDSQAEVERLKGEQENG